MNDSIIIDPQKGIVLFYRADDVKTLDVDGRLPGRVTLVAIYEAELPWQPTPDHLTDMENWARIMFPGAKVEIVRKPAPATDETAAPAMGGGSSMGGRLS